MVRNSLTKKQEDSICEQASQKIPQRQIAFYIGCSPRTVARVLVKHGMGTAVPRLQDEAKAFMKVLRKYQVHTPEELGQILKDLRAGQAGLDLREKQEMSLEAVQQYLNACRPEQLASLFYSAGLIKIAEMHNGSVMNATLQFQKEAAKGKVHYGQAPNYRQR